MHVLSVSPNRSQRKGRPLAEPPYHLCGHRLPRLLPTTAALVPIATVERNRTRDECARFSAILTHDNVPY